MQSLSSALTHCQFSDSGQMEVVLLMILNLMEDMLSGPGGDILSDESICDMMGRGLAICSQTRFSPVLRQTAEASMVRMCQIIFEAVKHLDVEANEAAGTFREPSGEMDSIVISTSEAAIQGLPGTGRHDSPDEASASSSQNTTQDSNPSSDISEASSDADLRHQSEELERPDSLDMPPYSLPSIRELFRVLVGFLEPNDRQQTDTMRIMALRIIHVALEVAGPALVQYPALGIITEDKLCSYLFQLVRSDNLDLLQEALVVASTLLSTCRSVLKLQQELFLSYLVACLHPAIDIPREPGIDPSLYADIPQAPKLVRPLPSQNGSGRSTPVPIKDRQKLGLEGGIRKPDARQAMVECISVLLRMPSYMVELFVNYDCDEDRVDLCEDMVGLLARNALPDSATWSTTSVPPLCLDALLRYVQFLAERLEWQPTEVNLPDADLLRTRRSRKKIIIKGANKFNESPKSGLGYLEAHGIIDDIRNPSCVASFLKRNPRISKKILGEFLSKKGNEPILEAFLDLFDFTGKRVDEALRVLLESFRLPGESALIERILTCFSEKYCANSTPVEVADKDAVYVLTYAIIMLNTDQHNPQIKSSKRMALEDFSRNLRGVNGGENFSPEYLSDIFNSIKSNEIILPDEHDNQHAFDYAWRELLLKADTAGCVIQCDTNMYDADLFASTWKPIVSTLSYVFMSATDDTVFARVVTGFDECARIAARYGTVEALDQIVHCLSHMTTIATTIPFNTSLNTEVQAGDNSVMVSELAVKLGRDFRAQLATLVLFRVVSGNEHIINSGWKHILRIWLNLFLNSLIPPFFSDNQDKLGIPAIALQPPSQVIDRASRPSEVGFFSAFTSYISSYAADDPPEPSQEELESTLCTVDCINQCRMGDIFARISTLSVTELTHLINALLDELPEDHGSAVISVKAPSTSPGPPGELKSNDAQLRYDPGLVYLLEFSTILTLRNRETICAFGEKLAEALFGVLRNATIHHPVAVARTVFYLLKLLRASYEFDFVNVPILLHTLSRFPDALLGNTASLTLQGICLCIEEPGPLRSEIMTSPDFWALLRTLAQRRDTSAIVFAILERGTTGTPPSIMADNYEAAISLLSDFASASRTVTSRKSATIPRGAREAPSTQTQGLDAGKDVIITRGTKAVTMIYNMTSRISYLMKHSHLESSEAWAAYWLPIFNALTIQFDILDRLMNSGQGDSLEEAVRENLKNVILFMATSKYLVPPTTDPSKEKLWVETWKRIDRFLPELKSELALDGQDEASS
ncbi:ARF guanine-nucleotide exchange factor 2 [Scedosporium apiospermum]|uniref:ARF guanine-nucleotide exchange factor 2 n=1 Tax=Pseudallescheria apiosperma TaxID=563466 RepID=A0A084GGQ4_PSEDA|nr:ARF guanine-nucleotide exchange factor 2 [Scedosporium apiospermum]KEZ46516.1 ARF guanine-nucleotide exchange factor 2 [Scedosporium apiospermum]